MSSYSSNNDSNRFLNWNTTPITSSYAIDSVTDTMSQGNSPHRPLVIAKRKHHTCHTPAKVIQARTGALRPKGRPYSSELTAKFCLVPNLNILYAVLERYMTQDRYNDQLNRNLYENFQPKTVNLSFTKQFAESIDMELENLDIASYIRYSFGIEAFTFVKVIRTSNTEGDNHVVKLETVLPPVLRTFANSAASESNIQSCSASFIKEHAIYPRYKANMKIYIIPGIVNQIAYADERMYLYDRSRPDASSLFYGKEILRIFNKEEFLKWMTNYNMSANLKNNGNSQAEHILQQPIQSQINQYQHQEITLQYPNNTKGIDINYDHTSSYSDYYNAVNY